MSARLTEAPGAEIVLLLALLVSLWTAAGALASLNRAVREARAAGCVRRPWVSRPGMLLLRLVVALGITVVLLSLVLAGPAARQAGRAAGPGALAEAIWGAAAWPLTLGVVLLVVAVLCWSRPALRETSTRWMASARSWPS